ncbi:copper oxidase [Sphaerotilus mobilis]|uniref:Multicopper oxidase n=1 Tax=Sphaerotilus mobilis TaxID=47994 RepID=A0A4Q7LK98_9BURK|nr:copper oxidase [Sphaerotilus mobilis]RZS54551.1 hypothetical protein EV685_2028 [Sphaerotilus mobilis]
MNPDRIRHAAGLVIALLSGWHAAPAVARPAGTVEADVVAIDQPMVYNRFGSYNPYGMVYALKRDVVDLDSGLTLDQPGAVATPCRVALREDKRPRPLVLRGNVGDRLAVRFTNLLCNDAPGAEATGGSADRPATRLASIMFNGVSHDTGATGYDSWDPRVTGIAGIEPGASITYRLLLEREGAQIFHDNAAPIGGQADGGSTVLGLFGSLNIEPAGADVYRSEVSAAVLAAARAQASGSAWISYEAVDTDGRLTGQAGRPLLNMHQSLGGNRWQLVHGDLNAVVQNQPVTSDGYAVTNENWFREFTVILHDELKTVQAFADVLDPDGAGIGLRDGFGINYGASGLGAIVAANRAGVGPAASCAECALEDFFLTSWANGDPAMVVQVRPDGTAEQRYPDDPGNVHHSYLGDPVKFRTLQAGVKETHVFHLHANQWFARTGAGDGRSSYLDSQTIGPRQGMSFDIAYTGSNRNLSVGDAIFHCHMYPHFAQGMWGLWRVHDVLEDGTRRLPDGELGPGTDPLTGETRGGAYSPALLPIRGTALAPAPTYGAAAAPGFPFFVPGAAGHRPPQPPLDLSADSQLGPNGLGRHLITAGSRTLGAGVAAADLSSHLETVDLTLLPHQGTPLERAAMAFHGRPGGHASRTVDGTAATFKVNGRPAAPGAPFADPCPATAPTRRYDVSAIELDLVVNKAGWHDPQARINVLSSDVAAFEGKTRPADPFFFRAHSGDCINFFHTNRTPEVLQRDAFQALVPTDTISQHIHLVKFDVMASDGGGNGWNYEDGTFARGALVERAEAALAPGGAVRQMGPDGVVRPVDGHAVLPEPAAIGFQTSVQRWWADELFDKDGRDRTLRTVFTHDHFGASSIQQHGFYSALVVEPKGSQWLDTRSGQPLAGGVGTEALVRGATDQQTHPDFREFMLASADFALLYTQDGQPVDPPAVPEAVSARHHNPYLVNYRNEPLPLRLSADGSRSGLHLDQRADPAYVFSSRVHGDPYTPVLRAYEGERVQLKLIHGAQEVQHVFTLHGQRWRREVSDPNGPYVAAQELGISEHMEMDLGLLAKVSGGAKQTDHLFHYGSTDALWNGAWGILRTYADANAVDGLTGTLAGGLIQPLTNTVGSLSGGLLGGLLNTVSSVLGLNGCPVGSPARSHNIEVWAARDLLPGGALVYNRRAGITDPSALLYVHAADVAGLRAGTRQPEPLVMRANAGDCITVRLTNRLPANKPVPDLPGDAELPTVTSLRVDDIKPSHQVGLHAQLVHFDPRSSDSANVGLNPEQLVAPGQSRNLVWYAGRIEWDLLNGVAKGGKPEAFGTIPLRAMSDVVKQGSQGLIGALIVEPQGSSWLNAAGTSTAGAERSTEAVIRRADGTRFREFVLHFQDGLNLRLGAGGATALPSSADGDDSYDQGERALNYRTEPLWSRIDFNGQPSANCSQALVLAGDVNPCVLPATLMTDNDARLPSTLRGLPVETPVFSATAGEAVTFRVLQADGRARQHSFRVIGHSYADLGIERFIAPGASLIAPGKGVSASLQGGAKRGYWHYRDGPTPMIGSGMWGLFKVN